MATRISIAVYFGDTPVTIEGDSLIDVMQKKSLIENLNTAVHQENLQLTDVTPIFYTTKEGYEYFGFRKHADGGRVVFGKAKEGTKDPDQQYYPKRVGTEHYTGFQTYQQRIQEESNGAQQQQATGPQAPPQQFVPTPSY